MLSHVLEGLVRGESACFPNSSDALPAQAAPELWTRSRGIPVGQSDNNLSYGWVKFEKHDVEMWQICSASLEMTRSFVVQGRPKSRVFPLKYTRSTFNYPTVEVKPLSGLLSEWKKRRGKIKAELCLEQNFRENCGVLLMLTAPNLSP